MLISAPHGQCRRRTHTACAGRLLLFLTAALLVSSPAARGSSFYLLAIRQVGAPAVEGKELIYRTDLVFRKAPDSYWIFFDKQSNHLVLDIYGGKIQAKEGIAVGDNEVFSELHIENRETSMALSGKQSLIRLKAEPGWRYEAK
jgi:hypothetical protein